MKNGQETLTELPPIPPLPALPEKSREQGGFLRIFIVTLLTALFVRFYIAQPFIVNGQSMEPTFKNGEYLIIDEITYRFRNPERGEVIVFRYPEDTSTFFIKRVIGLPHETVQVDGNDIYVTSASTTQKIEELYLNGDFWDNITKSLGENEYFVMGDNRLVSSDSRRWGPVTKNLIIGRAFIRFLPIPEMKLFPGDSTR